MNELIDGVRKLVDEEVGRAYDKFGPFHSSHEGHSVILEEVEESSDELDNVKLHLAKLWESIKNDEPSRELFKTAMQIKAYAELMAAEAIQAAVTAKRFMDLTKGEPIK